MSFFLNPETEKLVFTTERTPRALIEAAAGLAKVEVVPLDPSGRVDLVEVVRRLVPLGVRHLLLEGGGELNFSMLRAGLVDEVYLTVCPFLFGGRTAPTPLDGEGFPRDRVRKLALKSHRVGTRGEVFLRYEVLPDPPKVSPSTALRERVRGELNRRIWGGTSGSVLDLGRQLGSNRSVRGVHGLIDGTGAVGWSDLLTTRGVAAVCPQAFDFRYPAASSRGEDVVMPATGPSDADATGPALRAETGRIRPGSRRRSARASQPRDGGRRESSNPGPPPDLLITTRSLYAMVDPRNPYAEGAMGTIVLARDELLGRSLVLKILHERHRDNPELRGRFLREASITAQLQHPGIPPVFNVGTLTDGRPYFTMRLVEGQTLARRLSESTDPPRTGRAS